MPEDQVKISKESSSGSDVCCSDENYYPYGTGMSFEDDLVDALGADNLVVGDVVEVRGYAFVDSTSERSDKGGSNKTVRIQLTSLSLNRETDDRVKVLYGE